MKKLSNTPDSGDRQTGLVANPIAGTFHTYKLGPELSVLLFPAGRNNATLYCTAG